MANVDSKRPHKNRPLCENDLNLVKKTVWGKEIREEIFQRWRQGFTFSKDEPSALVQTAGGPCAIIVPVQAFIARHMIRNDISWSHVNSALQKELLVAALVTILDQCCSSGVMISLACTEDKAKLNDQMTSKCSDDEANESKKARMGEQHFHQELVLHEYSDLDALKLLMLEKYDSFVSVYGVLLFLYSLILTKGIEQIKSETDDPHESLIDSIHGHGSQSLVNLLLCGDAVSNLFDLDKEIGGMVLRGMKKQCPIGFLTLLEHLRCCEVGWFLKNPSDPVWILGSETHLTLLFSQEKKLIVVESPGENAKRAFGSFDTEGNNFIASSNLGPLLEKLNLVHEEEYMNVMLNRLDPESLGIIMLNNFLSEFYPDHHERAEVRSFNVYHYNGLTNSRSQSCVYQRGLIKLFDSPETQIVVDSSEIMLCLATKWPTLEIKWDADTPPSLN